MTDEYPDGFDTDPTSPGFVPEEGPLSEYEIVANDEPSIEDYPPKTDAHGAPIRPVVKIHDGVRDTTNR